MTQVYTARSSKATEARRSMSFLPRALTVLSRQNEDLTKKVQQQANKQMTTVVRVPNQTVDNQDATLINRVVQFTVPGTTQSMTINGTARDVISIVPNELVYDPVTRMVYNIGKPGVFAMGTRHWMLSVTQGGSTASSDSDTTTTMYLYHARANYVDTYMPIKGSTFTTIFLATGDGFGISTNNGLITDPITIQFNYNSNVFIVSRLSAMDDYTDLYVD